MNEGYRTCHTCNSRMLVTEWCATCEEAIQKRPDPATMTPDERAAEMEDLFGSLEVPFHLLHARIEALVGRPVFTHEFAAGKDVFVVKSELDPKYYSEDQIRGYVAEA